MRAWPILAALAASAFLFVTTETLPIGLLPQIAGGLHTPASGIGLLVTVYGLVVVASTIPLTRLTHRWPRRRLLGTLLLVSAAAMAVSALAPAYPVLLTGRIVTALAQAVFWAVVTPAAAALFPLPVRPRAIAVLVAGASTAPLLGVPAGTWLGQQTTWRLPFLALAALSVAASAVVLALMPQQPTATGAARGRQPDARRYLSLVVTTALTVTAAFTAFTCITPFLTDLTGLPAAAVGPVLLLRGVAGLTGAIAVSFLVTRHAWPTMVALIALQAVALLTQYLWPTTAPATIIATAAAGMALSGLTTVLSARVLTLAPTTTDLASAGSSTAFNVGITAGALIGSTLLTAPDLRSSALIATVITTLAAASALLEPLLSAARRAQPRREVKENWSADSPYRASA